MENRQPEVYERAPTLLGGTQFAGQGAVQVWSPDGHGVGCRVWLTGILLGAAVGIPYFRRVTALLPPGCWCPGRVRKLSRVTTDDAGIALTTLRGAVALPWGKIVGWYNPPGSPLALLYTRPAGRIIVNFTGYTGADRQALSVVIQAQCDLIPLPDVTDRLDPLHYCFMRTGYYPMPGGRVRMVSPGGR